MIIAGQRHSIDAILFDKDGTLIDFLYTWGYWGQQLIHAFSKAIEKKGYSPLNQNILSSWGICQPEVNLMTDYDRKGPLAMATLQELLTLLCWEGYKRGLSWAESKILAEQANDRADQKLIETQRARLLPGVQALLDQCKAMNVPIGIVTADESDMAKKQLEWLGIESYFTVCIGTDQVKRGKPFKDMVLLACKQMSVKPSSVVIIGDTAGDMMMAKNAGAALAITFDIHNNIPPVEFLDADIIISSYAELEITK